MDYFDREHQASLQEKRLKSQDQRNQAVLEDRQKARRDAEEARDRRQEKSQEFQLSREESKAISEENAERIKAEGALELCKLDHDLSERERIADYNDFVRRKNIELQAYVTERAIDASHIADADYRKHMFTLNEIKAHQEARFEELYAELLMDMVREDRVDRRETRKQRHERDMLILRNELHKNSLSHERFVELVISYWKHELEGIFDEDDEEKIRKFAMKFAKLEDEI